MILKIKRNWSIVFIPMLFFSGIYSYLTYSKDLTVTYTFTRAAFTLIILGFFVWLTSLFISNEKSFPKINNLPTWVTTFLWSYIIAFLIIVFSQNLPSFKNLQANFVIAGTICFVKALGAGFFEEFFFRGYLFTIFNKILIKSHIIKHQALIISVTTTVLFCCAHFYNLQHNPLSAVLPQVLYSFMFGMIFSMVRVLSGHVWPAAIMHFFLDFNYGLIGKLPTKVNLLYILVEYSIFFILSFFFIILVDKYKVKQSFK